MKKKIIASLLLAITLVPAFSYAQLPVQYAGPGYSAVLRVPTDGYSADFAYGGGPSSIILTAKNLNILGSVILVTCNYGRKWYLTLLPLSTYYNGYSIPLPKPVRWVFNASTDADVALISFSCNDK